MTKFLVLATIGLLTLSVWGGKTTPADSKVTKMVDGLPRNRQVFTDYVMRGNLKRSDYLFRKRKKGRVAYMGGSVTMRPWRTSIETWLQRRYPDVKFDFVMAGIGGTPAELGAFRVKNDVFKNGPVDLFFLEFAVNGGGVKEMEGIVRQAKTLNPNVDIVMSYFAQRGHSSDHAKGKIPEIVQEHEKVAKHYDVPSLFLYREIANRCADGRMHWGNFARDSVHPEGEGSDMYAACYLDFLEAAWSDAKTRATKPKPLPRKLDPNCYDKGRYVPHDNIRADSGFEWNEAWKPNYRVINILLPQRTLSASKPGSTLEVPFTGTICGLLYMSGQHTGIIEYSIDGAAYESLDTYNRAKVMPQYRILNESLKPGKHLLRVRVAKTKNEKSSGHEVRLLQVMAQ